MQPSKSLLEWSAKLSIKKPNCQDVRADQWFSVFKDTRELAVPPSCEDIVRQQLFASQKESSHQNPTMPTTWDLISRLQNYKNKFLLFKSFHSYNCKDVFYLLKSRMTERDRLRETKRCCNHKFISNDYNGLGLSRLKPEVWKPLLVICCFPRQLKGNGFEMKHQEVELVVWYGMLVYQAEV